MTAPTLFDIDATVRHSDPETSREAAAADRSSIEDRAAEIIRSAGWRGATCDDVHAVFEREGWSHKWGSTSRRLTTLKRAGRVEVVGTRRGESGKQQTVFRAVGHLQGLDQ